MAIIGNRIEKTEQVNWHEFKFLQPDNFKELSKDAMEKLKESIIQNDFIESFKVWYARDTDIIYCLDGFHRCKAMRELEQEGHKIAEAFPANFLKCKNKEEAAKLVLIFSSIYAVTQQEGLKDFLEIYDLDLNVIKNEVDIPNINIENLELLLRNANIDEEKLDEVPEPQKEAVSQLGDIFLLDGKHRVMCGDSTKKEDVEKLMDGKKADMVFTDPPYGMNLNTDYSTMGKSKTKYNKIIGDEDEFDMGKIFKIIECDKWFIWGADYLYKTIHNFQKGNIIVWAKRHSEAENKVFGSAFELCWVYPKQKKEIWFIRSINQSSERLGEHPTQKPTELGIRAISRNTNTENIILDIFLGSGTTLIAAEQTGRICYGMEIDPIYIDVILRRYKNLYPDAKIECLNRNFDFNKLYSE